METGGRRVVPGMTLPVLPTTFSASRDVLQRVAVHIVARARQQGSGRFGLRVTPGGFGTPAFGDDVTRVRVSGGLLVIERAGGDGSHSAAMPIDGSSLRDLAALAGVDLDADLDVGHDTPPPGDVETPLAVDGASARVLARWYALSNVALDEVVSGVDAAATPSAVQLWPEHFDAAIDVAYDTSAPGERRVNLGGSPGDGFHEAPYVYVGPWTADRPGDAGFWNAPFGAVLGYDALRDADDPAAEVAAFFGRGLGLLGG